LLLDRGACLPDPLLLPVLLNDAASIYDLADKDSQYVNHRATLVSAFTSLIGVSLLHVAAEYGNIDAARALIAAGADVNARAAVDDDGLNGHTPIFHTVNSNNNRSEPIMQLLLDAGAQTDVHLAGIHWGKGYEWETIFFDVTPISYAQIGLMPQVHRCELDIYTNIQKLLRTANRSVPAFNNIPNRYLKS
jgi:ankyrin repeat protein